CCVAALHGRLRLDWMLVGRVMASQRRRQWLVGGRGLSIQVAPQVERRGGAGAFQVLADGAQLLYWQREEAADLLLQCPDADDLAHVRGCGEGQEVARDVKGPGVHRP